MGFEYVKRPLRSVFGNSTVDDLTVKDDLTVQGDLAVTGPVTLTGGARLANETLTSTASALSGHGLSILAPAGTTADKTFSLPRPAAVGIAKYIVVNTSGARVTNVTVAGATATGFFQNSTFRTLAFSSNSTKQRTAQLVSYSTLAWAIVSKSTGVTLAG